MRLHLPRPSTGLAVALLAVVAMAGGSPGTGTALGVPVTTLTLVAPVHRSVAIADAASSGPQAVSATPKPKKYANCTALNKVYAHGVGRPTAKDKVASGRKPVTTFTKNLKLYTLNKSLDRDKDGVACEKA